MKKNQQNNKKDGKGQQKVLTTDDGKQIVSLEFNFKIEMMNTKTIDLSEVSL